MSALQIKPATQSVPICRANLMPFHLGYDGPAPLSTYFIVAPAKETVGAPDTTSEVTTDVGDDSQQAASHNDGSMVVDAVDAAESVPTKDASASAADAVDEDSTRHISTFRGRVIHGLDVQLPHGYVGVVLQPVEADTSAQTKTNGQKTVGAEVWEGGSGRATRQSSRKRGTKQESSEDENSLADVPFDQNTRATKTFTPAASFSSFTLWHPDIPVDERGDEYYRSLMEWTQLANVIHQTE